MVIRKDQVSATANVKPALKNQPGLLLKNRNSNRLGESGPMITRTNFNENRKNVNGGFPVVGIGASVGGWEAFTQLIKGLPGDTGLAFVLIQPLDPEHKSMLTENLSNLTEMPVCEIITNLTIKPNQIYVISPNTNLVISHGILHLLPRMEKPRQHLPIDYFFNSLAEERGNKAIGVILSGNGSDGAAGLKAIKAAGGITFVQDPESVKYDEMPRHAIAAGDPDFVLSLQEIVKELAQLGRHPYWMAFKALKTDALLLNNQEILSRIFSLLRTTTGADFTYYKPTTVKRRIMRRMALHNIEEPSNYIKYLQHNPAEIKALSQDVLIGVTSFFREPGAFDQLKKEIFPSLIKNNPDSGPLRIWAPGCSTGEETYSIAIALLEFIEEQGVNHPIQIFATDLNATAIEKARSGIYSESIKQDVALERLNRFFVKVNNGYQINKRVRELCIFAEQNIVKDPPFSRLDLISCRNVLIYLGPILQRKVIPIFHYALKPAGYLMLGTSESIGTFLDLFALIDKKYKIYTKKSVLMPLNFDFTAIEDVVVRLEDNERMNHFKIDSSYKYDLLGEADRILLAKYAPAGVVINDKLEILQFRGQTDPYLTHSPGLASFNLFKMTRPGLAVELRQAIHQAGKEGRPVRKESLRVNENGRIRDLNIEVFPMKLHEESGGDSHTPGGLKDPSQEKHCFLIVFEEPTLQDAAALEKSNLSLAEAEQGTRPDGVRELNQLKQELAATIEYQQSIIEQREAANEELRAAYEEIQSSNEELQSTHEEMETAKEELQATNEELTTVNDELRNRNSELNQVNSDLNNLLSCINIPIIILGNDLRIRRFTSMAEKVLNLIPTDVGRPLSDIKPNFNLPQLEQIILKVIDTLIIKEQEVQDRWGRWYSLCIRPYKTLENKIDGVIMTLYDINILKPSLEQIQEFRDYSAIMETVREPFLALDSELRVKLANRAFYRTFQVELSETKDQLIYSLGDGGWDIPILRALLEEILPKNSSFQDFKVEHYFPKVGYKVMLLSARRIVGEGNLTPLILLSFEDITGKVEKPS